jgi:hypothetical protein
MHYLAFFHCSHKYSPDNAGGPASRRGSRDHRGGRTRRVNRAERSPIHSNASDPHRYRGLLWTTLRRLCAIDSAATATTQRGNVTGRRSAPCAALNVSRVLERLLLRVGLSLDANPTVASGCRSRTSAGRLTASPSGTWSRRR